MMPVLSRVKSLAIDPGLPKWVKWMIVFGLLPLPGPLDELVLCFAVVVVVVRYRQIWVRTYDNDCAVVNIPMAESRGFLRTFSMNEQAQLHGRDGEGWMLVDDGDDAEALAAAEEVVAEYGGTLRDLGRPVPDGCCAANSLDWPDSEECSRCGHHPFWHPGRGGDIEHCLECEYARRHWQPYPWPVDDREGLLLALQRMVEQHCSDARAQFDYQGGTLFTDDGEEVFDSRALSASARAMRILAANGRMRILGQYDRRVIATMVAEGSA